MPMLSAKIKTLILSRPPAPLHSVHPTSHNPLLDSSRLFYLLYELVDISSDACEQQNVCYFFFLTFKLVSNHSCLPSPPRKSDALRTDTQRNKGHQLHPLVLINPFIPSSLKSDFLKSSHTWKSLIFPEAIFNFSSFKKTLANKIVKTCNQDYSAVVLFHH